MLPAHTVFRRLPSLIVLLLAVLAAAASGSEPQVGRWTTSRIHGRPDPEPPYQAVEAMPALTFSRPVTITKAPTTSRLFVVEVAGKIFSFPNDSQATQADLLVDLRTLLPNLSQTYGMAFHPDYPRQPYMYVCCILDGQQYGSVIYRFDVRLAGIPSLDPTSMTEIFRWRSGGHNGCSLKFGHDGYLYISTGDGTGPNPPDVLRAGQDVSNVLSAILRIDVDRGLPYRIPPDNPFVDLPHARGEIYAYGFRNPWKISFDSQTGDLWAGDVGWDTWELVFRVQKGGNYGWSIMEGSQPIHLREQPGPTPILPPVTEHDHSEARSITGGFVYRGSKFPELYGAYIYGDYATGKVWALWHDDGRQTRREQIAETPYQIVAWGEDHQGELYFLDYERTNKVYRLEKNPRHNQPTSFPRTLGETGLFQSVKDLTPEEGVVPYQVHAARWADGLSARRWLAIPAGQFARPASNHSWNFPDGTVIARTVIAHTVIARKVLDRPSTSAANSDDDADEQHETNSRRIETQLLHREQGIWRPYSYVWNSSQTDAELVPAVGTTISLEGDFSAQHDVRRSSIYRVNSRAECAMCHSPGHGALMAIDARQLDLAIKQPDHSSGQVVEDSAEVVSQLTHLSHYGLRLPSRRRPSELLVDPYDESADLHRRARSYLHVNCNACHRPNGGGMAMIQLDASLRNADMQLIDVPPIRGGFGIDQARLVAPGAPFRSVLLYRMLKLGPGRMPHLASDRVDRQGVRLIARWIASLDADSDRDRSDGNWSQAMARQESDTLELDGRLRDTSEAMRLAWRYRQGSLSAEARQALVAYVRGQSSLRPEVRDLFADLRNVAETNSHLSSEVVLRLPGNASRGKQMYWQSSTLQCRVCHQVNKEGGLVGPDLSSIGSKRTRAELLRSILDPSLLIEPEYRGYSVITDDGRVFSGRLQQLPDAGGKLSLRLADNKVIELQADEIEDLSPLRQSLMPGNLLNGLSPGEAADLLAYLHSLRDVAAGVE